MLGRRALPSGRRAPRSGPRSAETRHQLVDVLRSAGVLDGRVDRSTALENADDRAPAAARPVERARDRQPRHMKSWEQRERALSILSKETGYTKKPHGDRLRVALAFPNTYWVGMSNLGFQTIY